MKNRFNKILVLSSVFAFVACEKVIDIELQESDKKIVVEANMRSFAGESYVLLSETVSSDDSNSNKKISGGTVFVKDGAGVEYEFVESVEVPGRYLNPSFVLNENDTYDLTVNAAETVLTANAKTNAKPVIDSLTYIMQVGGFFGETEDTAFLVFYNFMDDVDETNYYRIRSWVNGKADENFYLTDDKLFNGLQIVAPMFGTQIGPRDTVFVELQSMDEANFTYLNTLSLNLSQSAFAAAPANPVTNIENGIGYFGAYTLDTLTLILP